jgi:hypothetical protein
MSFSENNEFSAKSTGEAAIRTQLLVERLDAESTEEYAQRIRELYRGDNEHLPNMLRMRSIAQTIVQPMGGRMRSSRLADAFYWGELIAYRMQGLKGGPDWAFGASSLIEAELSAQKEIVQEFLSDQWLRPNLAPDFMIQMIESDSSRAVTHQTEKMIFAVTDDMAVRPDERWHAILGFRHLITRLASDGRDAQRRSTDVLFNELMGNSGIEDIQEYGFVQVNSVKDLVMKRYAADPVHQVNLDRKDSHAVEAVREQLDATVQRAFLEQDDLVAGDIVRIEGAAVYVVIETASKRETVYVVAEDEYVEGTVEDFRALRAPSSQAVLRFQGSYIEEDGPDDGVDPFAVVLVLKDVLTINGAQVKVPIEVPYSVRVVMANQKIDILKYQSYTQG